MDDEFKLCWKNFQDNIASGFQNLYDRGDLVDVTLACDGKLLQAHKIVLAICSPYFQEILITNPCKHPIIILKDVNFNIMCELLEFMYQGVVNVKHAELQTFMKIGQLLQIKGLASSTPPNSDAPTTPNSKNTPTEQASTQEQVDDLSTNSGNTPSANNCTNTSKTPQSNAECSDKKLQDSLDSSPASSNSSRLLNSQPTKSHLYSLAKLAAPSNAQSSESGLKRRAIDYSDANDLSPYFSKKPMLKSSLSTHTGDDSGEQLKEQDAAAEQTSSDDFFLSTIPHISMVESKFDLGSYVKREAERGANSAHSLNADMRRNSFCSPFGLDYGFAKHGSNAANNALELAHDMHGAANDYSKSYSNHMEIPSTGSNVTMLSSTSLLHGNCIFNRNNTVATQQGMKTYWLCKSYRISMCRARCITHQGRVISATGVHNHHPHMLKTTPFSGNSSKAMPPMPPMPPMPTISSITSMASSLYQASPAISASAVTTNMNLRLPQSLLPNMLPYSNAPAHTAPQQLPSSVTQQPLYHASNSVGSTTSSYTPQPEQHMPTNLLLQEQQQQQQQFSGAQSHANENGTAAGLVTHMQLLPLLPEAVNFRPTRSDAQSPQQDNSPAASQSNMAPYGCELAKTSPADNGCTTPEAVSPAQLERHVSSTEHLTPYSFEQLGNSENVTVKTSAETYESRLQAATSQCEKIYMDAAQHEHAPQLVDNAHNAGHNFKVENM